MPTMDATDRHARKQVLLTRIAFERIEMRRDVARLQHATRVPALLRALVGGGRRPAGTAGRDGLLGLALALLGRYRGAAMLLGGLAPVWRASKGWRRVALVAGLGIAAGFAWRVLGRRNGP